MTSSFIKKTMVAAAVAGSLAATGAAQANVLNVSWTGAFTMLNSAGGVVANSPSDYFYGNYANGDGNIYVQGAPTTHGWNGNRTPVTGTMAFDTSTGAGVGTVTPFYFFGDTNPTHVANALGMTFQLADPTAGTIIGTMLFSWNGGGHPVSIVLNASGMFSQLGTPNNPGPAMIDFMTNGPTTTISGVGALPATNGVKGGAIPLGPSPIATLTTNTNAACAGVAITSQANAYTINTLAAFTDCFPTSSDTIGGSPIPSGSFKDFNPNFDVMTVHLDSFVQTPQVPVPAAVWLFGSGLLGLVGIARRKKKA